MQPSYIPKGFRVLAKTERMQKGDWYWNQGVKMWRPIPEESVGALPLRTVVRRKQLAHTLPQGRK